MISFCPGNKEGLIKEWLGKDYDYHPQQGENLGLRMAGALAFAFETCAQKAVLIGSDIPDILPEHIKDAFLKLDKSDVVIGPALDGGYWLIGFTRKGFVSSVFEGIKWSTANVFTETIRKCEKNELSVSFLPTLRDIDTKEDYLQFLR